MTPQQPEGQVALRRCARSGELIKLTVSRSPVTGALFMVMDGRCPGCGSIHVHDPQQPEGSYFNKETAPLGAGG